MKKKLVVLLILVSMLTLSFGSLHLMAAVEVPELMMAESGLQPQLLVADGEIVPVPEPPFIPGGGIVTPLGESTPKPL